MSWMNKAKQTQLGAPIPSSSSSAPTAPYYLLPSHLYLISLANLHISIISSLLGDELMLMPFLVGASGVILALTASLNLL